MLSVLIEFAVLLILTAAAIWAAAYASVFLMTVVALAAAAGKVFWERYVRRR